MTPIRATWKERNTSWLLDDEEESLEGALVIAGRKKEGDWMLLFGYLAAFRSDQSLEKECDTVTKMQKAKQEERGV